MTKNTPEKQPKGAAENDNPFNQDDGFDGEAYLSDRAEFFDEGLRDGRLEEFSGELGSVATLFAVGNEVVSGVRHGDEVPINRDTLPVNARHVEIKGVPADPQEVVVNTANRAAEGRN